MRLSSLSPKHPSNSFIFCVFICTLSSMYQTVVRVWSFLRQRAKWQYILVNSNEKCTVYARKLNLENITLFYATKESWNRVPKVRLYIIFFLHVICPSIKLGWVLLLVVFRSVITCIQSHYKNRCKKVNFIDSNCLLTINFRGMEELRTKVH